MKSKTSFRNFLLAAGSSLLSVASASGQLYWDSNGTTAGAGETPTGIWGTDNFWNTDSTGGAGTFSTTTLTSSDVFFSAGTDAINSYAIGLGGGTRNARLVTFEDGTVTLNNGTLSLGTGGGITVTVNTVTGSTISTNLTLSGSQTFNVAAGRTLTLDTGTFTRNAGATLNVLSTGTVTTTMTNLATGSLVNGIIGPWASFGTGASTRYATINGSNNIVAYTGGTAAATAANVTSTLGTLNYDVAAVGTLGAGANVNTLRYTGGAGTIAGALTTNGIMNVSGNALTFSGAITRGSSGLVVNSANGTINFNAAINGTGDLIIDGSGSTVLNSASAIIGGTGNLIKNGSGNVTHNGNTPAHNFTGNVIVNGGSISSQSYSWLSGRNVQLTNGYLGGRFGSGFTWTSGLGTGANQIQITGGTSGFSGEGNTGSTFQIGVAGSVLKWGASGENGATGFFNPTVFLANGTANMNTNGKGSLNNGIDLNGTNRTITSTHTTDGVASSGFTISGVISNSAGTAGFEKTGVGNLILGSGSNSFNGTLKITGGWITAGSSGALGGASNTIEFNGGTLRATGTITSPSTRSVTMTSNGIIDTNSQAISIAGNIGGAAGLTKNGNGTLTLSGTNNYGGVTTVNTGTLAITKEAALASNTAAKLNAKNNTTLALNVDSAGSAGFSTSNLNTLLGNISAANTAAQGLQAGATLGLNTATATGGTFTPGAAITDSTGASGGSIGLNKLGAGTLVFDQANTYTGNTTVTTGTLQLGSGGAGGSLSISSPINIVSGATFALNQSDTVTQGTEFSTIMLGAGNLANTGAGTLVLNALTSHTGNTTATAGNITLSHQRAIQFSALNTTGAGTVTLSGVTTPIFGGLANSGTTRNLASVIDSSYASVTDLTLNPQSGSSFTYSGVVADGAAGMSLTKIGAGTQTLTGANTYTGSTNITNGILSLSGSGSILSSAITFNGGQLNLINTAAETGSGRISNSAGITSNGGTLTYTNTSGAGVYAETIGSVALSSGQMNFNLATNQASTGSQTLTLAGLTQSGSGAVTFSAATTGPNATKNRILVLGASATPAGQIIGSWATTGIAANNQSDYAVYDASGYVVPRNIGGSTETTWTTAANAYTNALAAQTMTGTRTISALRNTGTTATLTLASGANLETYGVLNGAATRLTIAPGTGGVLTTPTSGGNLYLTTHGLSTDTQGAHNGISVTAPINNNGVDAVSLVKSGVGVLQLNATSNYSGGTVLNSGTLWAQSDASLGNVNGDITFGGTSTLLLSPNNGTSALNHTLPSTRSITVNEGAMATIAAGRANATITVNGGISGSGGVTVGRAAMLSSGGVGTTYAFNLLGNNTFTGEFGVGNGSETSAGGQLAGVTINTLADSTSPITLNFGSGAYFSLGSTASVNLSVPNRPVNLLNSNITIRNQDANNTMTLGSVSTSTASAQTLKLGDGGAGGFISGNVTNGAGSIAVEKTGSGTWTLSGTTNTFTGAITMGLGSALTTSAGTLNYASAGGNNAITFNQSSASPTLNYTGSAAQTMSGAITASSLTTGTLTLGSTGAGAVNYSNTASLGSAGSGNKNLVLSGTNTGDNILAGRWNNNTGGAATVTKSGRGTWILSGTNNYSGATTIQAGSLIAGANAPVSANGAFGNTNSALVLGNASTAAGDAPAVLINGAFTVARAITVGSLANTAAYNATIGGSNTTGTSIFSGNVTLNTTAANYTATLRAATGGTTEFSTGTWTTNNKAIAIGSSGNAGIVRLNNNISTSGGINVNFGTLELNSAFTSGNLAVASGATLSGTGSVGGNATLTGTGIINKASGTIGGTLGVTGGFWNGNGAVTGLITSSSGTFTIGSGANLTASNGLNVTGGTAILDGTLTGDLTAAFGTTVKGSGTITGAATISGNHNAGNSPGIQTFIDDLSYTGGNSVVEWELNANTTTNAANPNAIFDQIIVDGNLNFTNITTMNLVFDAIGSTVLWGDNLWDSNQSWILYDVAGTTTNFDNLQLTSADWLDSGGNLFSTTGGSFSLVQNEQDVVLTYVIPEPKAVLLGCLGVLLLLRRRR